MPFLTSVRSLPETHIFCLLTSTFTGGISLLVGDLSAVPQNEGAGPEAAQGVEGGEPRDCQDVRPRGRGFRMPPVDRGDSARDRLERAYSRLQQQKGVNEKV